MQIKVWPFKYRPMSEDITTFTFSVPEDASVVLQKEDKLHLIVHLNFFQSLFYRGHFCKLIPSGAGRKLPSVDIKLKLPGQIRLYSYSKN